MGKQIDEKIAASWALVRDLNTKFLGNPTDENLQEVNRACLAHQELMRQVNAILNPPTLKVPASIGSQVPLAGIPSSVR